MRLTLVEQLTCLNELDRRRGMAPTNADRDQGRDVGIERVIRLLRPRHEDEAVQGGSFNC
jgi:hypothetical protein